MKNVEPITDQEIEDIKKGVHRKHKARGYSILAVSALLLIVFVYSVISIFKWHSLTILFAALVLNLLIYWICQRK